LKEDGKIYSAIGCTETPNGVIIPGPDEATNENDVKHNSAGWAYNSSTTETIIVSCPLVREYTQLPAKNFHLSVLNETEEDVLCQVESYDAVGHLIDESSLFKFPGNDFDGFPDTIVKSNENVGDSFLDLTEFFPGVYYILQCALPAGVFDPVPSLTEAAYITTYQLDEVSK
jgi:hypothetical protein